MLIHFRACASAVLLALPFPAFAVSLDFRTVALSFATGSESATTIDGSIALFFGSPLLNDAGQVGFSAALASGKTAIVRDDDGIQSLRAVTGDAAPGTDRTFTGFESLRLNSEGDVAFRSILSTEGVADPSRFTIHRESGGALDLLRRSDTDAPGTAAGTKISNVFAPAQNRAGVTAYFASLTGGGTGLFDNSALYRRDTDGTETLVARLGDTAPGDLALGDPPGGRTFQSFSDVHVTDDGAVIFQSLISDDSGSGMAVFRADTDGTITRLARGRQPLGEDLPAFSGIDLLAASAGGEIAFTGFPFDGFGGRGLFRGTPGDYDLAARSFDDAPGTPGFTFRDFPGIGLNDLGEVAFLARLWDGPFGAITGEAPTTLFAEFQGMMERIIGVGDLLDVGPGDSRTISALFVASSVPGTFDTSQKFYNSDGQIAFRAFFEEGGSGVFLGTLRADAPDLAAIPLPPAMALLLSGLAGMGLLRRRRRGV